MIAHRGMAAVPLHDLHPEPSDFLRDVQAGLSKPQKRLPSMYFYDQRGSELFDRICELSEYYPTRTETRILEQSGAELAACLGPGCMLIELGSGSSEKTRILLRHLSQPHSYVPVDIARDHLCDAAARTGNTFADLAVRPVCADFMAEFSLPPAATKPQKRVVFFPGSTIGNFSPEERRSLFSRVFRLCQPSVPIPGFVEKVSRAPANEGAGNSVLCPPFESEHSASFDGDSMNHHTTGSFLIGFDLKKDRKVLERAYNDASGVTAAFNLNLLRRINRELGADFDIARFEHRAHYDEEHGRIEMHLVSRVGQSVRIGEERFRFARGETVCTEHSHKFSIDGLVKEAAAVGFAAERVWTDEERLFCVALLSNSSRLPS